MVTRFSFRAGADYSGATYFVILENKNIIFQYKRQLTKFGTRVPFLQNKLPVLCRQD